MNYHDYEKACERLEELDDILVEHLETALDKANLSSRKEAQHFACLAVTRAMQHFMGLHRRLHDIDEEQAAEIFLKFVHLQLLPHTDPEAAAEMDREIDKFMTGHAAPEKVQ